MEAWSVAHTWNSNNCIFLTCFYGEYLDVAILWLIVLFCNLVLMCICSKIFLFGQPEKKMNKVHSVWPGSLNFHIPRAAQLNPFLEYSLAFALLRSLVYAS